MTALNLSFLPMGIVFQTKLDFGGVCTLLSEKFYDCSEPFIFANGYSFSNKK